MNLAGELFGIITYQMPPTGNRVLQRVSNVQGGFELVNAMGGGGLDIWGVQGERYTGFRGSVEDSDAAGEKCEFEAEEIVGEREGDIAGG